VRAIWSSSLALLASLIVAPSAFGATFTVTSSGDGGDPTPDGSCGSCTLREAVDEANDTPASDTVVFAAGIGTLNIASTLTIQAPVVLRDDGNVELSWVGGAGPLLRVAAAGGGSRIEALTVRGAATGIEVTGAQRVTITRSPVFDTTLEPISLLAGANAGIGAPGSVRVGPRRGDGALPVSGSAAAGTVEVFKGDPASGPTAFLGQTSGGLFDFVPAIELVPGERVVATVTDGLGNTSELSPGATVPADIVSPSLRRAVAVSATEVRVHPSEPIDPASLSAQDFVVQMGGVARSVTAATAPADGSSITLTSGGWRGGEAGFVQFAAAGAVSDWAGNQSLAPQALRILAAPGDFAAPTVTRLSLKPRALCLTKARRCRRPGTVVSFVASEPGRVSLAVGRSKAKGERRYPAKAGLNRIRFDGRIRGKKLRAGGYLMFVAVEDAVGNVTEAPPFARFSVVRTLSRRATRGGRASTRR